MRRTKLLTLAVTLAFVGIGGAYAGWTAGYTLEHLTSLYSFDVETSVKSTKTAFDMDKALLEKGDQLTIRVPADGSDQIVLKNIGTLPAFFERVSFKLVGGEGVKENFTGRLQCDGITLTRFDKSQQGSVLALGKKLRIEPENLENPSPTDYGRHTVNLLAKLDLTADVNTACLESSLASLNCQRQGILNEKEHLQKLIALLKGGSCKVAAVPGDNSQAEAVSAQPGLNQGNAQAAKKPKPIDPYKWWIAYYEAQLSCLERELASVESNISSIESTLNQIREAYWEVTFYFDQYR